MNVTIIADASVCPDTGAAGYGFWISCERGKTGGHGAMKRKVHNSTEAEIMALLNGLHHALKECFVLPGDTVLLQSDCMSGLALLKNHSGHKDSTINELINYFTSLKKKAEIEINFKHVLGHTRVSEQGARYKVNRICDKQAKRHMKQQRRVYREQENSNA